MPTLVDKVQSIYAAFGRGDVPAILEQLAPDVAWEYVAADHGVPWITPRSGRAAVVGFFETLARELEIRTFVPKTFLEGPGVVAVLVDFEAGVKRNGRSFRETDEVHLWHFDDAGRVIKFRHVCDTHQQWAAWNDR